MKNRNELITVNQLHKILSDVISNGGGNKFIQVNEYFVGSGEFGTCKDQVSLDAIHVQDVMEYGDDTGDIIEC